MAATFPISVTQVARESNQPVVIVNVQSWTASTPETFAARRNFGRDSAAHPRAARPPPPWQSRMALQTMVAAMRKLTIGSTASCP